MSLRMGINAKRSHTTGMRRRAWALPALMPVAAVLLLAPPASADLTVQSFNVTTSSSQAGAHPDLTTAFTLGTVTDSDGTVRVDGNLKDVKVDLPPGLAGLPTGVPTCPGDILASQGNVCPPSTQVGTVTLSFNSNGFTFGGTRGLYNLAPSSGATAELGFNIFGVFGAFHIKVRPDDYGVTTTLTNVPEPFQIQGATVTIWGVPADPSHDSERFIDTFGDTGGSAGISPHPFLTNPTTCSGPLSVSLGVSSWQQPDRTAAASGTLPAVTGCDKLHFDPTISVRPTVTQVDSPSGYTVDLKLRQNDAPDGLATSDLRKAVVRLPEGVALSPAVADGLGACSDDPHSPVGDQLKLGLDTAASCPSSSKIGDATLTTPALPDQLHGSIYVGTPLNNHPYRIFVTLSGDGVMVKLKGSIEADPSTGQLTATFDNNPQQPFSDLTLNFKGGPRAPLTTPANCGTFTTTSDLTPWSAPASGPDSTPGDSFDASWDGIGGACPATLPFSPGLSAGVTQILAGAPSPFVFRLTRADRNQTLESIAGVKLPAGLVPSIRGVALCPDGAIADAAAKSGTAEQTSQSCPADSQIGTVQVGAGAGSHPLYLPGKVYLTGSYRGAPYGLAVIVPAVAGPYDLGTVIVRAAVNIDPTTAQLSVDTDRLPTILRGIPLQLRDIQMTLDRPGFMRNPTSCRATRITADAVSTTGTVAALSNRFQVGGCRGLEFSPRLSLKLWGRHQTRVGSHPLLTAQLRPRAGQANLKAVKVSLPLSLALDPVNSQHVCDFKVAQAVHGGAVGCPKDTIVGSVSAVTPLLPHKLYAPVYLVQGLRTNKFGRQVRTLPTLLIPLRGADRVALDLRARSSVVRNRLVTTFGQVPDVPVSSFKLRINGGRRGILVVTGNRSLCSRRQVANVAEQGQNGKLRHLSLRMGAPCGRAASHRRALKHRGAAAP